MKFHLMFLAAIFFSNLFTANAQIQLRQHTQLRAALGREEFSTVEGLLREMSRSDPEAFTKNNYDYLLARITMRQGKIGEAKRLFQEVASRRSILASYALWHQAELARKASDFAEEQQVLERLIAQHPGFLRREMAIQQLGASYSRTGKHQNAIMTLRSLAGTQGAIARENLARIGETQMAIGQTETARATLNSLLVTGSMDDASLRAITALDQMDKARNVVLNEKEHLRRARIYQFNRSFADARRHWLAIINNYPQSTHRAEALFQLGRGYHLEERYTEAIPWYERVHDELPFTDEGEQGFYFVGHSYQGLHDVNKAIARYEEFLKAYPQSQYFGYVYLNAIDTLRSASRIDEALRWVMRAQTEAKAPFIATRALFDRVKIRFTQANYIEALADLNILRTRNLNLRGLVATTNAAEVAFLRAYCFEKIGRFDEAINEYFALPEGRDEAVGYYGFQASERLRMLKTNLRAKGMLSTQLEGFLKQARAAHTAGDAATAKVAASQALRLLDDTASREEMLRILRAAYAKLPAYQLPSLTQVAVGRTALRGNEDRVKQTIADELLFLGLDDEAAAELAIMQPTVSGPNARNWAYTIAVHCGRGNCAERTLKFAEPILNTIPSDYRLDIMPHKLAEIFYPLTLRKQLRQSAIPRGVDPRFVLSIARQESRYNTRAKSQSAARGLMQFISVTSSHIAAQLGLRDFDQNDLYQPEIAILIGSQYLKNLFKEFTTPQAVAAAYNGGEDGVRRWIARARDSEIDRFVIEIAKRETKDYVFKVMNNYRAYQTIYPEQQSPLRALSRMD